MKNALMALALLVAAGLAHADKFLESRNKSGGKLILTKERCAARPSLRAMMATAPNQPTIFGCWAYIAGEVHVVYDDGERFTYPADAFTYVDEDKQQ